jgi:hypothetical protein
MYSCQIQTQLEVLHAQQTSTCLPSLGKAATEAGVDSGEVVVVLVLNGEGG